MPTPTEWAYVAGIIDGEGSIGVVRSDTHAHKNPNAPYRWHFAPYLKVANTSLDLMEWLQQRLPLRKTRWHRRESIAGDTYDLTIQSKSVKEILSAILPYLVIKNAQAELVLTWPQPRDTWVERPIHMHKNSNAWKLYRRQAGAIGTRTPQMYAEQCRIFNELRELNRRGGKITRELKEVCHP